MEKQDEFVMACKAKSKQVSALNVRNSMADDHSVQKLVPLKGSHQTLIPQARFLHPRFYVPCIGATIGTRSSIVLNCKWKFVAQHGIGALALSDYNFT